MYRKKNWIQINFHISKRKDISYQFIRGFLALIDGIIGIISFGLIWSSFEYEHCKRKLFKDAK